MCGTGSIHGEEIQDLRRILEARDFTTGHGSHRNVDVTEAYVDEISGNSTSRAVSKWSSMPAMAPPGPVAHRLFKRLNCEVTELFFPMDGRFPNHHPDPTVPENLEHLRQAVRAQGADLGIAFDGDSDRIGAIDENGDVIYGDLLLLIYGREILTRKPGGHLHRRSEMLAGSLR